jgi:hypothetical protein
MRQGQVAVGWEQPAQQALHLGGCCDRPADQADGCDRDAVLRPHQAPVTPRRVPDLAHASASSSASPACQPASQPPSQCPLVGPNKAPQADLTWMPG